MNSSWFSDNKKCVDCGTLISNRATLCKKCHNLFHSLFGNKNNNLGQLNWFFRNVKLKGD